MSRLHVLLLALVCSLAAACSVGQRLVAPSDEYLAYRSARTSFELEERLEASAAYLEQFPRGQWRDEVRPWFDRAEARYYVLRQHTAQGLDRYLQVLPEGPHAVEARRRLAELRKDARLAAAERLGERARETEARLAARAQEREVAREAFATWLARLLSIRSWGKRTSYLDSEFVFHWRIDPPHARCVDDTCTKLLQLPYTTAGRGEDVARSLLIEVVIELRDGVVVEARLQGPELFSRVLETSSPAVTSAGSSSRIEAIAFATDVVAGAAEASMPAASCQQPVVAPEVLRRDCKGWTLIVRAADNPGDDDQVIVRGPREPGAE